MRGEIEGAVDQGLVGERLRPLERAGGREKELRFGVIDSDRELGRGESAEDDRMNRAEPRAREHGDDGLRNHRHVDDRGIAATEPEASESSGEAGDAIPQVAVGETGNRPGDGAVVDQRDRIAAPLVDMAIESVVAGVEPASDEPAIERCVGLVENLLVRMVPHDSLRGARPELFRVLDALAVNGFVIRHGISSSNRGALWLKGSPK